MKINQYMCNMKVLIGLFLANSIGLHVFLDHNAKNVTDTIDISVETNQLMYFDLIIYTEDKDINEWIVYNSEFIYYQSLGVDDTLDIFLR